MTIALPFDQEIQFGMSLVSNIPPTTCASIDQLGWLDLREQFWPDCSFEDHLAARAELLAPPERFAQFIECDGAGNAIEFIEISIRSDYVNGTDAPPVAFLEG